MNIVITMAGRGSRFRTAGYDQPKYAVEVHGRTLFEWALSSLRNFVRPESRFIFVALREHAVESFVRRHAANLAISDVQLVELDGVTDGQATTVLAAAPNALQDRPLLIYNIDTFIEPHVLQPDEFTVDGWIPCFPGEGEGWSFARTDEQLRVLEVREKRRISDHASVGLYGFSSLTLYREAYETYYADHNRLEKGEKYIAPLYNQLLTWGRPVTVSVLPPEAVHPLGTPEEVAEFSRMSLPEQ